MNKKIILLTTIVILVCAMAGIALQAQQHKIKYIKDQPATDTYSTEEYNKMPSKIRKIARKKQPTWEDKKIFDAEMKKSLEKVEAKMGKKNWAKFKEYSNKRKPVQTMADCEYNCKLRNKIFNSGKDVDKALKRKAFTSSREKKKKGLPVLSMKDIEKRMTPKEKRRYKELKEKLKGNCADYCQTNFHHMRNSHEMVNVFEYLEPKK